LQHADVIRKTTYGAAFKVPLKLSHGQTF